MLSSCHSQNSLSVSSSHFIGQSFCLKGILPKCSIRQSFVLEYVFFAKLDQQIIKCKLPFRICITVSDTQQPLINNYWMRLSILWTIMEIEKGVRPRRITPSEISIIRHMIGKPNSIIVLIFIQNNSQFKNMAKTCLPASMLSSSSIVHV